MSISRGSQSWQACQPGNSELSSGSLGERDRPGPRFRGHWLAKFLDHSPQSKRQRLKDPGQIPGLPQTWSPHHCHHTCCVDSWAVLTLACQNIQLYTYVRGQGKERSLCLENHRDHCRYSPIPRSPWKQVPYEELWFPSHYPTLSTNNLYNFPFCSPGYPSVIIIATIFYIIFKNSSVLHVWVYWLDIFLDIGSPGTVGINDCKLCCGCWD